MWSSVWEAAAALWGTLVLPAECSQADVSRYNVHHVHILVYYFYVQKVAEHERSSAGVSRLWPCIKRHRAVGFHHPTNQHGRLALSLFGSPAGCRERWRPRDTATSELQHQLLTPPSLPTDYWLFNVYGGSMKKSWQENKRVTTLVWFNLSDTVDNILIM